MKIGTISGAAALAVGSLILSAPAMAADLPEIAPVVVETPPPPAPGFSWNGPYVGVFGFGVHLEDVICFPYEHTDTASTNGSIKTVHHAFSFHQTSIWAELVFRLDIFFGER